MTCSQERQIISIALQHWGERQALLDHELAPLVQFDLPEPAQAISPTLIALLEQLPQRSVIARVLKQGCGIHPFNCLACGLAKPEIKQFHADRALALRFALAGPNVGLGRIFGFRWLAFSLVRLAFAQDFLNHLALFLARRA